ncbi:MAG TPA: gluconate 2-dehydrogenase subunit 3 family protein [Chitinophagaceae bacterium]|nr:gluconate 2-dehydrogenase subunit 3 family protein [Chitinophagaceae bacterium]
MNRRLLIKNILLVSAGASLLPACMQDKSKSSFLLKNITLNGDDEQMLADLTAAIIPSTDGVPGAGELSSHLFVMMMIDECTKKEDQQKFTNGMSSFESLVHKKYNTTFGKCSPEQKKALLTDIEQKNNVPGDVQDFYSMVKRLTIQSFVTSQYFLTKVRVYELVPGRYHGCVPVKTA